MRSIPSFLMRGLLEETGDFRENGVSENLNC